MSDNLDDLRDSAVALLERAYDFFEKQRGIGAVKWVNFENNELLIFTKSEYRHQLMENIDKVNKEPERYFKPYGDKITELEKENTELKAKLAHVERELEEEIKVLDYYGDPENWQDNGDRSANFMWNITIDESDQEALGIKDGDYVLLGGGRARQRKKERKEFNEHN